MGLGPWLGRQAPVARALAVRRPLTAARLATILLVASSLMLLGIVAMPLWLGRVPIFGDLGDFHWPLREFYARCLVTGESFDWFPGIFCGFYVVGEGQLGAYHPLHWLLYRTLPLPTAFAAETVAPFPFMLLGMYVFLRRHTDRAGALLGALMLTFSTWFLSQIRHVNIVAVLAHLPWQLWACDKIVDCQGRQRVLAIITLALLIGSQLLLGYPPAFWYGVIALGAYACFLLPRGHGWKAWSGVAIGFALGVALGAVQLIATYSVVADSSRDQVTTDWIMDFSLIPNSAWGMLTPIRDLVTYFGAAPLLVIGWWLGEQWKARGSAAALEESLASRQARRLALASLAFAAWAFIMTLGRDGGLYYLHMLLPVVGKFRHPIRFLILMHVGVAIAAAVAFNSLLRVAECPAQQRKLSWLPWCAATLSVISTASTMVRHPTERLLGGIALVVMVTVMLALIAALRGNRLGIAALVLLTAVELGVFSLNHIAIAQPAWRDTPTLEQWIASQPGPPKYEGKSSLRPRVFSEHRQKNHPLMHGFDVANGYVALEPKRQLAFTSRKALRLAGVQWYLRPRPASGEISPPPLGLKPANSDGWYKVPDPLPRIRLVTDARVSEQVQTDIERIPLASTALVTRPLRLDNGPVGRIRKSEYHPGRILATADVPGRQLLVVSESYHPGWRVTIDGRPAAVERVYGDFLGCVLECGSHEVAFCFRPTSLVVGKWISGWSAILACSGLVAAAVWPVFSRRPRRTC